MRQGVLQNIRIEWRNQVDNPMTEAMNHNRMCVPSSINGAQQSVEKQDIQVGIEMMEVEIHVRPCVVQITKRQAKKRKFQDGHKTTLYAKWRKQM